MKETILERKQHNGEKLKIGLIRELDLIVKDLICQCQCQCEYGVLAWIHKEEEVFAFLPF